MKNPTILSNLFCHAKSFIFGTFILISTVQFANAQSNSIQEVKINNDGFNELRTLVINNFDYTTPDLALGTSNSQIEFDVAENGKISNVKVEGDCQYVNLELKNVIKNLIYKIDKDKIATRNMLANHYVMPVTVNIGDK